MRHRAYTAYDIVTYQCVRCCVRTISYTTCDAYAPKYRPAKSGFNLEFRTQPVILRLSNSEATLPPGSESGEPAVAAVTMGPPSKDGGIGSGSGRIRPASVLLSTGACASCWRPGGQAIHQVAGRAACRTAAAGLRQPARPSHCAATRPPVLHVRCSVITEHRIRGRHHSRAGCLVLKP